MRRITSNESLDEWRFGARPHSERHGGPRAEPEALGRLTHVPGRAGQRLRDSGRIEQGAISESPARTSVRRDDASAERCTDEGDGKRTAHRWLRVRARGHVERTACPVEKRALTVLREAQIELTVATVVDRRARAEGAEAFHVAWLERAEAVHVCAADPVPEALESSVRPDQEGAERAARGRRAHGGMVARLVVARSRRPPESTISP
jgi:hypothetical protein